MVRVSLVHVASRKGNILSQLVAVTGADGFIGSHLVEALVRQGDRVRAMVQYNSFDSWGWLDSLQADVRDAIDIRAGDVRDAASTEAFVDGADVVLHLAALIAVPYSYQAPRSYIETNIIGTLNVLEACRRACPRLLVQTSTSEVYGTAQHVPISEDHPLQGQSPYSASKIGADKLAESYHRAFGVPVATLRPFNTFGPRQSARAIIPAIVTQIASGASEIRIGDVRPRRDFLFVTDTARAFLAISSAPQERVVGHTFNAGTGRDVSVAELIEQIAGIAGRSVEVVTDPQRMRPAASEVLRLQADATLLTAATGWTPTWSLGDGLRETFAWFTDPQNLARFKTGHYAT